MRVSVCISVLFLGTISNAKNDENNTPGSATPKHNKMETKQNPKIVPAGDYTLVPGQTLSFTNEGYPMEEKDLIERQWNFKAPTGHKLSLDCSPAKFVVRGQKGKCWMVGFDLTGREESLLRTKCGDHAPVTYESTSGSLGFLSFAKTDKWKKPARKYSCSVKCSELPEPCDTTEASDTTTATAAVTTAVAATGSYTFAGTGCDNGLCGIKKTRTRIVGGTATTENEYPWQAGLTTGAGNVNTFCGASIINDQYILTAAHCVDGANPSSFFVTVGQHNQYTATNADLLAVESITMHPNYNSNTYDNDIAIIQLAQPLTFSDTVMPVCAPDLNEDFSGLTGTVTGWGTTSSGGTQPFLLQEVDVPILTNAACSSLNGFSGLTDNMFCAGATGVDSCQGDSGGPLVVQDPETGLYEQAGVVSWGYGCAVANQPGVYADVGEYVNWINGIVSSGNSYCP